MLGVAAAFGVPATLAVAGDPLASDARTEADPRASTRAGARADSGLAHRVGTSAVSEASNRLTALVQEHALAAPEITFRGEEREETLPVSVELVENDVLPVGELRIDETGGAGLRHEIVEVILHDGVAVDERVVSTTVRPPEPMIVSVGTSTSSAAARDWDALARCESGGDPTIVSRSGRYHGLYQFDRSTWESVGGTGLPSEAPPDEQRRRAILLYEQRGAQPWPTCGRHL